MSQNTSPARVIAPGRILQRELEARKWTHQNLAEMMGQSPQRVDAIVEGNEPITAEIALLLATAFETSADLWMNLECRYHMNRSGHNFSDRADS